MKPYVSLNRQGVVFLNEVKTKISEAVDFTRAHLLAPTGHNDRYIGVIRGNVASREQARTTMNSITSDGLHKARKLGSLSHEAYFQLTPPGSAESLELLGVDVWSDLDGMNEYYSCPDFNHAFDGFFTSEPSTLVLQHPAGQWVEW